MRTIWVGSIPFPGTSSVWAVNSQVASIVNMITNDIAGGYYAKIGRAMSICTIGITLFAYGIEKEFRKTTKGGSYDAIQ